MKFLHRQGEIPFWRWLRQRRQRRRRRRRRNLEPVRSHRHILPRETHQTSACTHFSCCGRKGKSGPLRVKYSCAFRRKTMALAQGAVGCECVNACVYINTTNTNTTTIPTHHKQQCKWSGTYCWLVHDDKPTADNNRQNKCDEEMLSYWVGNARSFVFCRWIDTSLHAIICQLSDRHIHGSSRSTSATHI